MQSIFDAITEWIKELLIGAIEGNLSNMFGDVNEKVGTIAAEVGATPQSWNGNIFSMIQTLSETVIIPNIGNKAVIGIAVLLIAIAPFIAVRFFDGRSEFGTLYYGHNQPRYIQTDTTISKEESIRAVYKYTVQIDTIALQQMLITSTGFNGQFLEKNGYLELKDGEHKNITTFPRYQTWTVNYHLQEEYTPRTIALNEKEAVTLAWTYLAIFGITPDAVQYEPLESNVNGDFRLEFIGIDNGDGRKVVGQVTVYLAADGELMSISDNRIWCEYVRDVLCISPLDSIQIAKDIGVGDWNGTAYIFSIEEDYAFIDGTGYLVPAWKINANFIPVSGNEEYKWSPIIDAVK